MISTANLLDGVYDFLDAVLDDPVFPVVAVGGNLPYVIYRIDGTEPFEYSTKGKGWDTYGITIECYGITLASVSANMETIWTTFENSRPSVSGAT